jgi:hypothetical protein
MSPRKGDARSPDSEKNPPSSSVDRGNPLPRVGASQFGLCSNASDYRLRTPVQRFHLARPPCSQKGINAIGAVRDEFLKISFHPPLISERNLIDEAPSSQKMLNLIALITPSQGILEPLKNLYLKII